MGNDIDGIERSVIGFNKVPNEHGNHHMVVRYALKPMSLSLLKKLFFAYPDDPYLIDPYEIDAEQAKALKPYIIDGKIDLDKYNFSLNCCQADGWDWSEGYPPKKIET